MSSLESLSKARSVCLVDIPTMNSDRFSALVQRVADALDEAAAAGLARGVKMREPQTAVKQAAWERADGWRLMAETNGQ